MSTLLKARTLLAEDNPTDALLLRQALDKAPGMEFEVSCVETLAECRARLKESRFDVVLVDLGLPDSAGLDTFVALRKQFPETPILVLTGLNNEAVGLQALKLGAQDYLVKGEVQFSMLGRLIHFAIERHQLKKELEARRQSQKMEAIGRLASGVAHDFNNLLSVILGHSELLLQVAGEEGRLRPWLQEIQGAAQRGASLTRQLLAFGRKQTLDAKVFDLNALILDFQGMLARLIGKHTEISVLLQPDLGRIKADTSQIEQVILNLVVNARDAMPGGGRITIETADQDIGSHYAHEHLPVPAGRYVMLAVSDTGTGIDEETRARLFEPFFTTKEPGKGTGLGLATVYGIVKQSGGYIWMDTEPGKGTSFKMYFPRVEEGAAAVSPLREAAS